MKQRISQVYHFDLLIPFVALLRYQKLLAFCSCANASSRAVYMQQNVSRGANPLLRLQDFHPPSALVSEQLHWRQWRKLYSPSFSLNYGMSTNLNTQFAAKHTGTEAGYRKHSVHEVLVHSATKQNDLNERDKNCCDRSHPVCQNCAYIFELELPEGFCIGLTCKDSLCQALSDQNHWLRRVLHPEEIGCGAEAGGEAAVNTFFLGRLAMRKAISKLGNETVESPLKPSSARLLDEELCILKDDYGRPRIPEGFIGSISHKKNIGVALVALDETFCEDEAPTKGIGVDIEQSSPRSADIGKKVLTKRERDELGKVKGVSNDEEILLRFSLKESLYKAMHPLICRYVGFQEVEMTPHEDGTATVTYKLGSGEQYTFGNTTAHWRRINDDLFLTSASVCKHGS